MAQASRWHTLGRMIPEFAIIVVGVLVALQVETWRGALEEASDEREQLVGLHADLLANRTRYANTIESQERMLRLSHALLSAMHREEPVPTDSVALMFTMGAGSWFEVEPVTGAYDALIASGDISLIKNRELRRRLAEFAGDIEAGFEDQDNLMDILFELQRHAAQYLAVLAPQFERERFGLPPVDASNAASAILSDDKVGGLLFVKTALEENRLARQTRSAEAVETILQLIDDELNKP